MLNTLDSQISVGPGLVGKFYVTLVINIPLEFHKYCVIVLNYATKYILKPNLCLSFKKSFESNKRTSQIGV